MMRLNLIVRKETFDDASADVGAPTSALGKTVKRKLEIKNSTQFLLCNIFH
jgi:hypothetical protein